MMGCDERQQVRHRSVDETLRSGSEPIRELGRDDFGDITRTAGVRYLPAAVRSIATCVRMGRSRSIFDESRIASRSCSFAFSPVRSSAGCSWCSAMLFSMIDAAYVGVPIQKSSQLVFSFEGRLPIHNGPDTTCRIQRTQRHPRPAIGGLVKKQPRNASCPDTRDSPPGWTSSRCAKPSSGLWNREALLVEEGHVASTPPTPSLPERPLHSRENSPK